MNVVLNVGGIFASIFGIVCVVKIAFIKPWQSFQVDLERSAQAEEASGVEYSGRAPSEVVSIDSESPPPALATDTASSDLPKTLEPVENEGSQINAGRVKTEKPKKDGFWARLFRSTNKKPGDPATRTVVVAAPVEEQATEPGTKVEPGDEQFSTAEVEPPTTEDHPAPQEEDPVPITSKVTLKLEGGTQNKALSMAMAESYFKARKFTYNHKSQYEGIDSILSKKEGLSLRIEMVDADSAAENNQIVAIEGIAMVVHPTNQIEQLTVANIESIHLGDLARWSQLGVASGAITICMSNDALGTSDLFRELVLSGRRSPAKTIVKNFKTAAEVVSYVAKNPLALGVVPIAKSTKGTKHVSIKATAESRAVPPIRVCAETLEYPLCKPVYWNGITDSEEVIEEFFDYATGAEGQKVVADLGLMGLGELSDEDIAGYDRFIYATSRDRDILPAYKKLIKGADRLNSRFNLRFKAGEDFLTAESGDNLAGLIEWLTTQETSCTPVLIGFSDSVGKFKENLDLSRQRAEVIANQLKQEGIQNVITGGFGEEMPVGDNDSEAGRAINRRVEVWIRR